MKQSNLSVIITGNEEIEFERIKIQLNEIKKMNGLEEIIFLSDCSEEIYKYGISVGVRVFKVGPNILNYKKRAIGARIAKGDILIFIDTSLKINPSLLEDMVSAVKSKKADLAVSTYTSTPDSGVFNTDTVEYIHNLIVKHIELQCASLYHDPFVISKEALKVIGVDKLVAPLLAKMIAIEKGLKIEVFQASSKNKSKLNKSTMNKELLLDESLHSLAYWMNRKGRRSNYTKLGRRLDVLNVQKDKIQAFHFGVTAIIPASNEEKTIGSVIKNAFDAGVSQVVVVDNGSKDKTRKIAKEAGAQVVTFPYRIGHDVGRAVGVIRYPSSYYLFLDADMIISPENLTPFITAITKNNVDVALNNLSVMLEGIRVWDAVTWSKYFLNHALNREDLDVNTLTAIPNALTNKAVEIIGPENLAIPTVAMVKAILAGLNVQAVKEVDVISPNRFRNEFHRSEKGNLIEQLIIGDMSQGIYELILHKYGRVQ